jgi:outer membrane protein TolC
MPGMRVLAFVVALGASTSAFADEPYAPPPFLTQAPPLPASSDPKLAWRLDLAETLRIALRQNLDVIIERKDLHIARRAADAAAGSLYEPTVTAGYAHGDAKSPPTTSQEGEAGEILNFVNDDWRLGIAKRFTPGTRVSVDMTNGRSKSTLGTAVAPLNYRSTVSLGITQPLLRGFSPDLVVPQIDVLRAHLASKREHAQLVIAVTDVITRAEAAYWNVLQALYRHDLALRTQQGAQEQMALTQRQIDAGTLSPSDAIGVESTVAQRQLEVVQAEQAIEQSWDQLRAVMNLPRDQWARPILPTDVPTFAGGGATVEQALETALGNRPELAQLDVDLKTALLAIRKAENDQLPQVDVGVSTSIVGQDTAYGGALAQLGKVDAWGWNVFVNFTWTPMQRESHALTAIARLQREQATVRRDQAVQNVWFEVRDAVRQQTSADRQLRAARRFRELAEQSLALEQRKFLTGTAKNIDVAQRQDAVARAQLAELDALISYNRATTSVLRATGRLLPERHLEIDIKGGG